MKIIGAIMFLIGLIGIIADIIIWAFQFDFGLGLMTLFLVLMIVGKVLMEIEMFY